MSGRHRRAGHPAAPLTLMAVTLRPLDSVRRGTRHAVTILALPCSTVVTRYDSSVTDKGARAAPMRPLPWRGPRPRRVGSAQKDAGERVSFGVIACRRYDRSAVGMPHRHDSSGLPAVGRHGARARQQLRMNRYHPWSALLYVKLCSILSTPTSNLLLCPSQIATERASGMQWATGGSDFPHSERRSRQKRLEFAPEGVNKTK